MLHAKNNDIKDLVLRCVDVMILACAANIRSGWRSIFLILEYSTQGITDIASIAFDITDRLILNNFEYLVYDFVELMNCLVAFVASTHTELAEKAIDHFARCSNFLANGTVANATSADAKNSVAVDGGSDAVAAPVDEDAAIFRLWWPLLLGLATAVGDARFSVRKRALETLRKVLLLHGKIFSPQAWGVIFKVSICFNGA